MLGAAAIIDRGADAGRLNVPLQALVRMKVPAYPPRRLPAVRRGAAGGEAGQPGVTGDTVRAMGRGQGRSTLARISMTSALSTDRS